RCAARADIPATWRADAIRLRCSLSAAALPRLRQALSPARLLLLLRRLNRWARLARSFSRGALAWRPASARGPQHIPRAGDSRAPDRTTQSCPRRSLRCRILLSLCPAVEIGRASCRERWCIAVVGGGC